MKRVCYIVLIMVIGSCISKANTFTINEIADFHDEFGNRIVDLCDSLRKSIKIESAFCVEFRTKAQDFYFYKCDSSTSRGYFESDFVGNVHQKQLLSNAIIHEICFDQKHKTGLMKTFLLKRYDKVIQIEVLSVNAAVTKEDQSSIFFQKERCVYRVVDAW